MGLRIGRAEERPDAVTMVVDGEPVPAHRGESVAAALFAAGVRRLRESPRSGQARGLFCMMGSCQECVVLVDGRRVPACRTPARDGLVVTTGVPW